MAALPTRIPSKLTAGDCVEWTVRLPRTGSANAGCRAIMPAGMMGSYPTNEEIAEMGVKTLPSRRGE